VSKQEQHSLEKVVESISQLIAVTKQWMLSKETRSTQQLVLTAERIKALDRLEKQIVKELKSAKGSSERVWQLVNVVIATVTRYALDRLSDSIQYKFRREQWVCRPSLPTAKSFTG
jgi:Trp operon repressor